MEIKLRLPDAQAYAAVAQALEPGWRQDHWLEDQYFDGPNGELDAGLVALRCRIYDVDRRAVLALKVGERNTRLPAPTQAMLI